MASPVFPLTKYKTHSIGVLARFPYILLALQERELPVTCIPSAYSAWVGRPIVMLINSGKSQVPLRGELLSESTDALRIRLHGLWDVDIPKEMVAQVADDIFGFHGTVVENPGREITP